MLSLLIPDPSSTNPTWSEAIRALPDQIWLRGLRHQLHTINDVITYAWNLGFNVKTPSAGVNLSERYNGLISQLYFSYTWSGDPPYRINLTLTTGDDQGQWFEGPTRSEAFEHLAQSFNPESETPN